MAMCTVASFSISDESQIDTESIETNVKEKCYERTFAKHDLCPFVNENYKIALDDVLTDMSEPLTLEEAYTCLNKLLVSSDEETTEIYQPSSPSRRDVFFNFRLLSPRISYKDFIMDIMDIETLEETKVDNRGNQHDGYLCSIVVNSREVFCVIDIYY